MSAPGTFAEKNVDGPVLLALLRMLVICLAVVYYNRT